MKETITDVKKKNQENTQKGTWNPGNKSEETGDLFVNVESLAQCFTCEFNNVIYHYYY